MNKDRIARKTIPPVATNTTPPTTHSAPTPAPSTTTKQRTVIGETASRQLSPRRGFISKSIYFNDSGAVQELESIVRTHPQCSFSGIFQRLLTGFLDGYGKKKTDDDVVIVNVTIIL